MKFFQEVQSELNQVVVDLNQFVGEVVYVIWGQSGELVVVFGKFSDDFDEFFDVGIEMVG